MQIRATDETKFFSTLWLALLPILLICAQLALYQMQIRTPAATLQTKQVKQRGKHRKPYAQKPVARGVPVYTELVR